MDFKLVRTIDLDNPVVGDLFLDATGQLVLVDGVEAIAQQIWVRLQFFKGEWFLDRRQGVPYFENVFIKNPSRELLETIFRGIILDTPNVESLDSFLLDIETATRTGTIDFVAVTDDGLLDSADFGPFLVGVPAIGEAA